MDGELRCSGVAAAVDREGPQEEKARRIGEQSGAEAGRANHREVVVRGN